MTRRLLAWSAIYLSLLLCVIALLVLCAVAVVERRGIDAALGVLPLVVSGVLARDAAREVGKDLV